MNSSATISECGRYRYRLWRRWDSELRPVVFVMLNPSTADADIDDPTIRKCIGFAKRLGFGGIEVVNLFGFRATKPADLWRATDPCGPDNRKHLGIVASAAGECDTPVICAWGAHARKAPKHAESIRQLLIEKGCRPMALRLLNDGTPEHPLMLPYSCELVPLQEIASDLEKPAPTGGDHA